MTFLSRGKLLARCLLDNVQEWFHRYVDTINSIQADDVKEESQGWHWNNPWVCRVAMQ